MFVYDPEAAKVILIILIGGFRTKANPYRWLEVSVEFHLSSCSTLTVISDNFQKNLLNKLLRL